MQPVVRMEYCIYCSVCNLYLLHNYTLAHYYMPLTTMFIESKMLEIDFVTYYSLMVPFLMVCHI